MPSKHLDIEIIVNGQPTVVSANADSPLRTVIPKALEATGNTGQPPENWELRSADGVLLDITKKIESFNFPVGVRLLLNLKAGVGGT
jgi:hypothetical protein